MDLNSTVHSVTDDATAAADRSTHSNQLLPGRSYSTSMISPLIGDLLNEQRGGDTDKRVRSRSVEEIQSAAKMGSPLREYFLDVGKSIGRKGIPSITSDNDLRMQFWRSLPLARHSSPSPHSTPRMLSTESDRDVNSSPLIAEEDIDVSEDVVVEKPYSSAALRESMEHGYSLSLTYLLTHLTTYSLTQSDRVASVAAEDTQQRRARG